MLPLFHESAPRLLGMTATQTGHDDTLPASDGEKTANAFMADNSADPTNVVSPTCFRPEGYLPPASSADPTKGVSPTCFRPEGYLPPASDESAISPFMFVAFILTLGIGYGIYKHLQDVSHVESGNGASQSPKSAKKARQRNAAIETANQIKFKLDEFLVKKAQLEEKEEESTRMLVKGFGNLLDDDDDTIPLQRDVSASRQDLARELTDLCKEIIRNYESSNNLVKTIIQKSFKYSNALEAVEDQFALQDQLSES